LYLWITYATRQVCCFWSVYLHTHSVACLWCFAVVLCSQGKLAEMKVEKALDSVNRVARRSNEPGLRRVSQDLNLVRNSIKLARASMGTTGMCVGIS